MNSTFISFLKKILLDTLSVNLNYSEAPYNNITNVDIGLRKGLKNSDALYDGLRQIMGSINHHCFYLYTDPYFLSYFFFHPTDNEDVISFGPFLQAQVDMEFLNKLTEKHHLKYSELESIQAFLHELPVFTDHIRLTSVLVDIVNYINPDVSFTSTTYNNETKYSEEEIYTPVDDFMLKAQATENRYQLEEQLCDAVSKGNTSEAISITRHFMSMRYEPRIIDTLYDNKTSLFTANTILRIGAGRSDIHPIFLHELSSKYVKLIHSAASTTELSKLHEKMVHDYCLLVKNKSRSHYSTLISNALNYIDFNLSQKLTLSVLAEFSHVSPQYLSKSFKNEVKITITEYINTKRVHESLKLLSTTDMMVQDIASYVGIVDFNYFTKIFKKYIGVSPRQYRKNLDTPKEA